MSDAAELERIRGVLGLARADVNKQKPDLAIETLRRISEDVESCAGTHEWAEFPLVLAEAFNAKHSEAAGPLLQDAGQRIGKLPDPPLELAYRLHYGLGYFYQQVRRKPSQARRSYVEAKETAVRLRSQEFTARAQLRITCIDLEIDKDPELENFKTLRRVAQEQNVPCEDQLAAWYMHLGEAQESADELVFARGYQKRTKKYFSDLLSSVRLRQ